MVGAPERVWIAWLRWRTLHGFDEMLRCWCGASCKLLALQTFKKTESKNFFFTSDLVAEVLFVAPHGRGVEWVHPTKAWGRSSCGLREQISFRPGTRMLTSSTLFGNAAFPKPLSRLGNGAGLSTYPGFGIWSHGICEALSLGKIPAFIQQCGLQLWGL